MGWAFPISISLDRQSLEELDLLARQDSRCRSSMIRKLIRDAYKACEGAPTSNDKGRQLEQLGFLPHDT